MRKITTDKFCHGVMILVLAFFLSGTAPAQETDFQFGVNANNWQGQIANPAFADVLQQMGVQFVVWHISPEEIALGQPLQDIIEFCRRLDLKYLFNTELVNYVDGFGDFQHSDGTYRWDIPESVMEALKDDSRFLGIVYDEPFLMQALNGERIGDRTIKPYFAETRNDTIEMAYEKVVGKILNLTRFYGSYNKRLIFEMVFPDYAHSAARGGAVLAPKLLKENYNDLMYHMYSSAARQYRQNELWGCVDLWFLDQFPEQGQEGTECHTPQELFDSLAYSYRAGFDYVYIENVMGLIDSNFQLSEYGKKVVEFHQAKPDMQRGDWRTVNPRYLVRRFPDGYWGQEYSFFIPDHPYGSAFPHAETRQASGTWLALLSEMSQYVIQPDANNWNAVNHAFYGLRQYVSTAGLIPFEVIDHQADFPVQCPYEQCFDLVVKSTTSISSDELRISVSRRISDRRNVYR